MRRPELGPRQRASLRVLAMTMIVASCSSTAEPIASVPEKVATRPDEVTSLPDEVPDGIDRPNPFRTGRTLVIAHAGGDGLFPENTLLAYERSIEMGSEVIDIDVRASADGVLIGMHDSTVDRTTNGTGTVRDLTYRQLAELDAGWDFNANGTFAFRGQGITIPRLDEVLKRFPDHLVTIDLKDHTVDIVEPICELVERLDRLDSVYVGVDTAEQVMEFRRLCPLLRTSGTDAERQAAREARERGDVTFRSAQTVSQPSYLDDDGSPRVTAESIAAAHARNVAVFTWVIDNPEVMRTLVTQCVDGIYTRRPDLLRDVVASTPTACEFEPVT